MPDLSLRCPRGVLRPPGPFPRVARAQYTAPVAFWRYRSRFRRVARAQLHYPGPSWALGLLWPTSPVPGVPTKQNSTFHSHTPSQSMNSCTPSNGFRAFSRHQQQNDLLLVNLNKPLTNIKLTPGSLGWESLLPPTSHSHHAYHIRSTHTQARLALTHSSHTSHFTTHTNTLHCHPS